MANFDIVDVVTLPVFTSSYELEPGVGFTYLNKPYTTVRVPVFEYTGELTKDMYYNFPADGDILFILASVYNRSKAEPELAIFDNYTMWAEGEKCKGTAVEYRPSVLDSNIPHLFWNNIIYSQGSCDPLLSEHGFIIKSPTSGLYWYLQFRPDSESFLIKISGIDNDTGIPSLVDFTGPTEVPPVEDDDVEVYEPGGVSKPDGGGGTFGKDEESDDISLDIPLGSVEGDASATGMYTRYLVNSSYLDLVGDWLWADEFGLYIAKTFISLIYGDPAQSLISLMSYPFNLEAMNGMSVVRQNLHWGHHESEVVIPAIRNSAISIDWGTISLKEYWGNFLDYSPHTKIDLYLPWGTGFVSIDPGQCVPGTLRVITNVELSKGSCIHNVIGNDGCVIGSFAGQCAKQLPLISSDFASKAAGLVTAAASGIAATAVSGGIAASQASAYHKSSNLHWGYTPIKFTGVERGKYQDYAKFGTVDPYPYINRAAGQMSTAIKTAGKIATSSLAITRTPVHVNRNGGFTDGSASLSIQYPYIILSRPSQNMPEEYGKHYGYPSNIYSQLAYLKGYTEVGEIHLKNIPATNDEILEIDRLLKSGVIL